MVWDCVDREITGNIVILWDYIDRDITGNIFVVAKEQDSDDEQIDKGITLKSKSIMQKTLYFLKKNEMNNDK